MSYICENLIFRQLFDQDSWTYTYLLGDSSTREAVIIDSVKGQVERDLKIIKELDLDLKYSLDTHLHADHITGASELRNSLASKTAISKETEVKCADLLLEDGNLINFGSFVLKALATPGHTNGCMCFLLSKQGEDPLMVFTGDTLFIRGTGRTDFQQGSASLLYDNITQKLFTLAEGTIVFPGHDYKGRMSSTIGEEMKYNPRLGQSKTKEEFIKIMSELNLAYPKHIQVAVPANMECGK